MKNCWKRLLSGVLALTLAGSLALPGMAVELAEEPAEAAAGSAELLDVTAGSYTPGITVQPGGLYTLIALPATPAENVPANLTAADLVRASGQALFIGSAVADQAGRLTFQDVRLRTAQAAVYYVTGPGLSTPYREATRLSTSAEGRVITAAPEHDSSARITLVDKETGYRYNTGIFADASGYYTTGNLAPGKYLLRAEKPGYLPYLSASETEYLDVTNGGTVVQDVPLADYVGDVNGDGGRDMADLAALLLYYGKEAPEGFTADLDYGGSVGAEDVALLVPHLRTGTASAAGAALSVQDNGGADDAAVRYLSFSLEGQTTVSAAAFSLSYYADTVQPLTPSGGRISPVDGSSIADCLVAADGFAAQLVGWKVEGDIVTLSFALTSDTPHAAGELARFYYRPISGSTDSLHHGAFHLDQAAALAGRDTLVTQAQLSYPNCDSIPIDSLVIDQKGSAPVTLTIPPVDRTTEFPLSATGYEGATAYPDLKGVSWSLEGDHQGKVTVRRGLLTVTADAPEGELTLRARYVYQGTAYEDTLTVSLVREASAPDSVKIFRGSSLCQQTDSLSISAGQTGAVTYTARVYDQYDQPMAGAALSWSLSKAPAGLSVQGGALRADWSVLKAGKYTFDLCAQTAAGIQATVTVTLTVRAQLGVLTIDGPTSAVVPASGGNNLELFYGVTAYDQQGNPMALEQLPVFTVSPSGNGVGASQEVGGSYVLTISPVDDPATQAGTYTLTVVSGDISASLQVTLSAPGQGRPASQAAIYTDQDTAVTAQLERTFNVGEEGSVDFSSKLLDADSKPVTGQSAQWQWSLSGGSADITLTSQGDRASIQVGKTLAAGSYALSLTAAEKNTGLSVSVPVVLILRPTLSSLRLSAPATLTLPTGKDLVYTLPLSARDGAGQVMTVPEKLEWSVVAKGTSRAPAGVSIRDGVLTVTPAAVPGTITVSVTDPDSKITTAQDIALKNVGEGKVLALYRQITVDGKVVQALGPVSVSGNSLDIKEGQSAVYTYTAMELDLATNTATPVPAKDVRWMGTQDGTFVVDDKAQTGSYSSTILAAYDGQSAAATAQVNVYPNIQDLRLDFGEGFELEPPYTLGVPAGAAKTYTGRLMASILREGKSLFVPLSELGLSDYDVSFEWQLTGVYITLDKPSGALKIQVEPTAIQNSMDPPQSGEKDIRVLTLHLQYFPGETLDIKTYGFYLEKEVLKPQDAVLRRGVGTGMDFAFDTPQADAVTAPAGTLSNAYALEILDQYRRPLTGQGKVTWTLAGSPRDAQGNYLISTVPVTSAMEASYPTFSSLRRLRVADTTPPGTYSLTLGATCGDFTRSIPIQVTVTALPALESVQVSLWGDGTDIIIPNYYTTYNSTTLNNATATAPFTAILRTPDGYEMDPQRCRLNWSVTTSGGQAPAGVSVAADPDAANGAVLTVTRAARPTGSAEANLLRLTASLMSPEGTVLNSATTGVELVRNPFRPTLLKICQNGSPIAKDSIQVSASSSASRTYTFTLVDQYDQAVPREYLQLVTWTTANDANAGVSLKNQPDSNKGASVTLTVSNPRQNTTFNLTASLKFTADGSEQLVYATIPLSVTVTSSGDSSGGGSLGGGGGGGGGGGDTDTPSDNAGAPASLTISGSTTLTTAKGKAASQVYSCSLRDKDGLNCSLADRGKVIWSATGLTAGITFDTSNHTLSVPATVPVGTYKVTITAAYSSAVRRSVTVTVTVTQDDAQPSATPAPTDVTLRPTVTQSGSAGTATLTTAQEQALLAANTASGGTVTIEPTGGNALTSLTFSLTANTAKAVATQKGQALRLRTTLGTVLLSAQSLQSLAGRGGSNVTITLASSGNTLRVDLVCGSSATSLPGAVSLRAPVSGNVVSVVNDDGSERILKKALVENGQVTTALSGSTQLKISTRTPSFSDIQNHWAREAIIFTASRELFQGTSATTFDPGGNMTRSMLVTVLHRLEDTPAPGSITQFRDVEQNSWYTNAVSWAHNKGIVQGTSTGFEPATPVSREQLATILYRYAGSLGVATSQRGNLSGFSDQSRVSTWARDAMEWAVSVKLINGKTGGLLDPGGYASRAEVSTILERFIRYLAPTV